MNFMEVVENEMELTKSIILKFPWEDKSAYAMWLAQTYYMVCHSTRLVGLAGAYCDLSKNDLHARFIDHSKEERGHEKICLSDINALGFKLTDFPKLPSSQAMFQIQYYWIQHVNPASFFGYTYALEMLAVKFGSEVYSRVSKAHGNSPTKFMRVHSEDDVEHMKVANKILNGLTQEELSFAIENMSISSELYREMLIGSARYAKSNLVQDLSA